MIGPHNKVGRPGIQWRRDEFAAQFGVTPNRRNLTARFMDQLVACKDDESRRILLGVSK